ncbi:MULTISPECIES: S1C family serine protease [Acidiphilium]|jgi:serine protease Do|uniref:Serine protease Do n=1 Tax=Acidiphilium rubrum TaxID=526 RepID=A0A8G2FL73_ACIRU|nr:MULTISPECIES: trypsin-like peptidase domain-containing protein [Acidiphilium]MBW4034665.1 PDZ domain-containing protein [Pseudomonadota bacterium]OYW03738.1 MAG: endopeptidase [Acidiphilium sp. 37-64-53]OZB30434.1 MAG: endopeptidase [Acidiphilium sp. 34-64-41]SIQ27084.1 serine protease Do [Acidiphilium rubrum]HQT83591.1 trypsin-like peptidase domain-containing protein [Acidiphilium rubrum]
MPAHRRAIIAGLAVAPWALRPHGVAAMPSSFAPLVRQVAPTVVGVAVTQFNGQARPAPPVLSQTRPQRQDYAGATAVSRAAGSGFIVSASGIIVTNNHVVGDAQRIIVTLDDGQRLRARVIGADQLTDLAIIKVEAGRALPRIAWGNSAHMQVGDWILAAGNPFDLGTSFTAGIISARGRQIGDGPFDHFLQLDAPINPGNSGGPSFDMTGHVIGVNTAIVSPSGGSVGIGFAIPSNMARRIVDALIAHGSIPRGWLGVSVSDLPTGQPGVRLTRVDSSGPAGAAGLQPGDIVIAINHLPVNDASALIRAIASVPPGTVEHLRMDRDGRLFDLSVTVGRRPAELGSD